MGPEGPQGPPGEDAAPMPWTRGYFTIRDNAVINLGSGGSQTYWYRIHDGMCTVYFYVKWGTNPSSGGGEIKITGLPAPWSFVRSGPAVGLFAYYSSERRNRWPGQVSFNSAGELLLKVSQSSTVSLLLGFRIWDGNSGVGTGFPENPDFFIDASDSFITGEITYPVA
jgi:hypothetical protein